MITGIILPFSISSAILHAKLTARATEKSYLQIKQKISPFPRTNIILAVIFLYIQYKSLPYEHIWKSENKKVVLSSRWRRLGI